MGRSSSTRHRSVPQYAGLYSCPVRLGGVLDDAQPMPPRDFEHRVEVRRLAVKMRRKQRFSALGDRPFDLCGIEIVGRGIGLDQDRRRARHADRKQGRDIAVARDDHLVAGADAERAER